ncbi:Protein kinase domain containing protein [Planoprotostelium fungivorum]|uniref:Protein kinase domain containing protein n=1 Tax=Planoprotostelium fungivorum TaxID=1890364 RepID=A0A2P6MY23_9EUKA|nr:Protein kinase domain containing protein [Planoprotostelium fungivorum]
MSELLGADKRRRLTSKVVGQIYGQKTATKAVNEWIEPDKRLKEGKEEVETAVRATTWLWSEVNQLPEADRIEYTNHIDRCRKRYNVVDNKLSYFQDTTRLVRYLKRAGLEGTVFLPSEEDWGPHGDLDGRMDPSESISSEYSRTFLSSSSMRLYNSPNGILFPGFRSMLRSCGPCDGSERVPSEKNPCAKVSAANNKTTTEWTVGSLMISGESGGGKYVTLDRPERHASQAVPLLQVTPGIVSLPIELKEETDDSEEEVLGEEDVISNAEEENDLSGQKQNTLCEDEERSLKAEVKPPEPADQTEKRAILDAQLLQMNFHVRGYTFVWKEAGQGMECWMTSLYKDTAAVLFRVELAEIGLLHLKSCQDDGAVFSIVCKEKYNLRPLNDIPIARHMEYLIMERHSYKLVQIGTMTWNTDVSRWKGDIQQLLKYNITEKIGKGTYGTILRAFSVPNIFRMYASGNLKKGNFLWFVRENGSTHVWDLGRITGAQDNIITVQNYNNMEYSVDLNLLDTYKLHNKDDEICFNKWYVPHLHHKLLGRGARFDTPPRDNSRLHLIVANPPKQEDRAIKILLGDLKENEAEMNQMRADDNCESFGVRLYDQQCTVLLMDRFDSTLSAYKGDMHSEQMTHLISSCLQNHHRRGLMMNDIKTENILVKGERIFVSDFGLSDRIDEDGEVKSSCVKGTPGYLSPEMLLNEFLTQKSDIWSLGATLLVYFSSRECLDVDTEIMSNEDKQLVRYFEALDVSTEEMDEAEREAYEVQLDKKRKRIEKRVQLIEAVTALQQQVDVIKGLSPHLKKLIRSMLSFDPKDRPTAKEIADKTR